MNMHENIHKSDLKIFAQTIESEAYDQIKLLLAQDAFKDCKVRIMSDVHAGAGCVIGFTANLGDKVIPNVVGVDIGCGMLTTCLGKVDIDYNVLDAMIRKHVPSGRDVHETPQVEFPALKELFCFRELKDVSRIERSIGTLGGGNHFIELSEADDGTKYLIIHSGSRNLGKQVAEYYQRLAIDIMSGTEKLAQMKEQLVAEYKAKGRSKDIQAALKQQAQKFHKEKPNIPEELCYLTGEHRLHYLHDMVVCQVYASTNRKQMAETILRKMKLSEVSSFETVHNYIDVSTDIVRKGAIRAMAGEKVLIPINMRDGSILGVGKGNEDWNFSAPHGAGRLMSRRKAKDTLTLEEFQNEMAGVFTTSVSQGTLDEAPMAYKPMAEIINTISDTVDIEQILIPKYNFKAGGE